MERKIIHIDMDAFFASVEQRDDASLRGKPIAVGFDGERGVVSTASYEARRYGVHSAQSMVVAHRLCPELIVVPCRHDYYAQVSAQIHAIFADYTDLIEPISLDEAFLDVTHNKRHMDMAVEIAREIKQRIADELHLTASAGVSYNKFLAKIASDFRKPDGLCVIHPTRALDFIASLRVEQFWGVGPKTAERMHRIGVFTGEQLREVSRHHLCEVFGKMGNIYYDFARGIDLRPVVADYVRKSVGCEQTYLRDISQRSVVIIELYHLVVELVARLADARFEGRTLTLKVKYADFTQISKRITTNHTLSTKASILPLAKRLLAQVSYSSSRPIRLLGLSVSNPLADDGLRQSQWVEGDLPFEEWWPYAPVADDGTPFTLFPPMPDVDSKPADDIFRSRVRADLSAAA